jgi:YidC/Oxa1 family membrane protein insertase
MFDFLFLTIITPIELLIETACAFPLIVVRGGYGFAIICVSVFVSFLCLPLYVKAEKLQEKERLIQTKMEKRVRSIQKCFKGDERHLILSMYYRENHYHPIMALRSSVSLLIQIPFFIAAYSFLSHFEVLRGVSFFIITDLGAPDNLLSFGGVNINLLPVIMTVINIVSGIIYTKGFPFRERVQLYLMALIFFVLLYGSPSALVIYWTCNNIFSLIKNILYKAKNHKKLLIAGYLICLFCLIVVCIYVIYFRPLSKTISKRIIVSVSIFIACIPLYLKLYNYLGRKYFSGIKNQMEDIRTLFILSCAGSWVLCGLVIPFNVAASDPGEFSFLTADSSPFGVLVPSAFIAAGVFIFWPVYMYILFSDKIKLSFAFGMTSFVILGVINSFLFSGSYGMLSKTLTFPLDTNFFISFSYCLINILACGITLFFIAALFKKGKIRLLSGLITILLIAGGTISVWKAVEIQKGYRVYKTILEDNAGPGQDLNQGGKAKLEPAITLSKTGKNVIIIMLDRAVNSYLPLIFEEKPELKPAFSGFVYYPNTLSFFRSTILGVPPLFGGYEYTPEKLHARKNELMKDKHDESLLMLPTLFQRHEYSVSVYDLPFVNYQHITNISFFTEKGFRSDNIIGKYSQIFLEELGDDAPLKNRPDLILRRNFLMYSLFAAVPPVLRAVVYRDGSYWNAVENDRQYLATAIDSYSELYLLPKLTAITEEGNTFTEMVNTLTHSPAFLRYPDYTVTGNINEIGPEDIFNGNRYAIQHYHVNAATYLLLAKWLDYLKSNNVYNNTRIIFVADHDQDGIQRPFISDDLDKVMNSTNPLLLVKDFDAEGDIRTDRTFMTNADVPLLAVKDLIRTPINPFTGKEIKADKENGINIYIGGSSNPSGYPAYNALEPSAELYHVKDNIFDINNWEKITVKD